MSRFIALIIVTLFISSAGHARSKEPLSFEPLDEERYAETVTLSARLTDGSYLMLQAMLTNGGIGDEKPACRILYVSPKGVATNQVNRDGDWRYLSGQKRLELSSCRIQASSSGLKWKATTDDMSAEVSLAGSVREMRPPRSKVSGKDEFFESFILLPWGRLTAKVKAPKLGRITSQGHGTLVKTRSTMLPPDVAKHWFKLYAYPQAGQLQKPSLIVEVKAVKSGKLSGWVWHSSAKKPRALTKRELKALKPQLTTTPPKSAQISLEGIPPLTLTRQSRLFKYEPVRQYGMMGRLAKRWIGDPLNITSSISVTFGDSQSELIGFLEDIEIR